MYKFMNYNKFNSCLYILQPKKRFEILSVFTSVLRSKSSSVNEILKKNESVVQNINNISGFEGLKLEKKTNTEQFINWTPSSIQPYLKIMRLHKPIGSWLLFWPCSWSIALAAGPGCFPDPHLLTLFGLGSIVMRGAGCTINDMFDRDIDKKVERTRDRPLVNGSMTIQQAFMFLAAQCSVGLLILLQLNWYSVILGASSLGLVITYPLMKRITHWPQFILGMTFNWGILLGYSAVTGHVDWPICLPMYISAVCWTIVYDTIYAHQDVQDDILLGIKSTAIKFKEHTKKWLSGFAMVMTSGLTYSGIMAEQTWPYYCAIALVNSHLIWQIYGLNINSPKDCANKFVSNHYIGMILFGGIILGNLLKTKKLDDENTQLKETG